MRMPTASDWIVAIVAAIAVAFLIELAELALPVVLIIAAIPLLLL